MPRNIIIAEKRESLKPNSVIAVSTRQLKHINFSNLQLRHAGRYVNKCNYKVS